MNFRKAQGWGARMAAGLRKAVLAGLFAAVAPAVAQAQVGSYRYASIVVDNGTGRVTEAVNADAPRYPASLTKLMTLYMAFEAMREGRLSLNEAVPVSAHAASMEPSKLGLAPGSAITVQEAILAIVTKSANDVACALGERIGGSESRFAQMMTLRARALGMTHTTFRNASGLPDSAQVTTARDLAVLAHHLIQDFPEYYHYFSVPEFMFRGRIIPNHDHMLTDYQGADGLKTGYTVASGHNLVTSAVRGGVRLIGVVMGAGSNAERDVHMATLLDDSFVQLGVPVERRPVPRFHIPSLIASAEAAPLRPHSVSWRRHHGGHLTFVHLASQHVASAHHSANISLHLAVMHGHAHGGCSRHHCYGTRELRRT